MAETAGGGAFSRYRSTVGAELRRVEFLPEGEPTGGIMIVHGLGDHIGRYDEIGSLLAAHGLYAVGVDFPGHGESEWAQGHIGTWNEVETILEENIEWLREKIGTELPLGVMAHSMGAFVTMRFLQKRTEEFQFAWLSSMLVRPGLHRGPMIQALARQLAKIAPRIIVDSGIRQEACHPVRGKRDLDPLWHSRVSVGWGAEMMRLEPEIQEHLGALNPALNLLMTHGSIDTICPPEFSRGLFDRVDLAQKEYVLVEDMMHEPFRGESHRKEVFAAAGRWLTAMGFDRVEGP